MTNIEQKSENIDGSCLKNINRNDLHRFGINLYKDNTEIFQAIQTLVNITCKAKQDNTKSKKKGRKNFKNKGKDKDKISGSGPNECIICMDNSPNYACIPCGHKCLCKDCKDNVIDNCPVCRNPYDSVIKIFT